MGFLVSQEFPSRFLKGEDIAGKEMNVTISDVRKENVFSRWKNEKGTVITVYFKDKTKGVIVKKERATDLKNVLGSDDTDGWLGQTVCIFTEKRKTKEGIVDVIRFKQALPPTK